jgi:hypothetical protein
LIAMDTVDQVQGVSLPALRHVHLIVQCRTYKPLVNAASAKSWITELAQLVGMKLLIQPQAVYSNTPGNRGLTAIAAISTSHKHCIFGMNLNPLSYSSTYTPAKSLKKISFSVTSRNALRRLRSNSKFLTETTTLPIGTPARHCNLRIQNPRLKRTAASAHKFNRLRWEFE